MRKTTVLIVDDSALIRKLLTKILSAHPDIRVVDCAVDAQDARKKIKLHDPDVVTLDIEMPGMNGLEFLEKIMTLRPTPVIMISTFTQKGAETSLEALRLGAVDVVAKPQSRRAEEINLYAEEIQSKVIEAARVNIDALASRTRLRVQGDPVHSETYRSIDASPAVNALIAIGASTGGTEAILSVLEGLPTDAPGTVITQHIPESFARSFARRLNDSCAMTVKVAENDEPILTGHAYVAPGDQHLSVQTKASCFTCLLSSTEPVNRHRPSVDVLFDSVARSAGKRATGVLLTGMGKDGASGLLAIKEAGGKTLVQDEQTSVVWGMPGAAYKIGASDLVLPLESIAPTVLSFTSRCVGVPNRS